jgi:hypothetical protein
MKYERKLRMCTSYSVILDFLLVLYATVQGSAYVNIILKVPFP